jgi:hypothetical protein
MIRIQHKRWEDYSIFCKEIFGGQQLTVSISTDSSSVTNSSSSSKAKWIISRVWTSTACVHCSWLVDSFRLKWQDEKWSVLKLIKVLGTTTVTGSKLPPRILNHTLDACFSCDLYLFFRIPPRLKEDMMRVRNTFFGVIRYKIDHEVLEKISEI